MMQRFDCKIALVCLWSICTETPSSSRSYRNFSYSMMSLEVEAVVKLPVIVGMVKNSQNWFIVQAF